MYGYFANKSKHRLIVKNIHKNMAIYLKNRKGNGYNTKYYNYQNLQIYYQIYIFKKREIIVNT